MIGLLVLIALLVWSQSDRKRQHIEQIRSLDVLLTKVGRWHRLQERLLDGPVPARYELREAQEDLQSAILGLRVILEN